MPHCKRSQAVPTHSSLPPSDDEHAPSTAPKTSCSSFKLSVCHCVSAAGVESDDGPYSAVRAESGNQTNQGLNSSKRDNMSTSRDSTPNSSVKHSAHTAPQSCQSFYRVSVAAISVAVI